MSKAPTHCQDGDDGTWHAVGSTWINSKCMRCDCTECCSTYMEPRSFPDDCVSKFDSKACKYRVFKKNDPSVECPIFAAVGK
ncbi:beta-microseminoprotein-like [Aplochiton taeniatus]